MSLPVATTVTRDRLDAACCGRTSRIARGFKPMTAARDGRRSARRCAEMAADGRFELYKTTAKHEGPVGRAQHGFPPAGA